jgi:hypothetical protein
MSPPLESFHKDFKTSTYIFNSASENYNRFRNNQKGVLALFPTLVHSSILVFIQFNYNH